MNSKRSIFFSILAAILCSLFLFIIFGENGVLHRNRMGEILEILSIDNERLVEENLNFYRRIDRLKNDPDYVESIARRELGMVGKDEIVFNLPPSGKYKKR